MSPYDSTGQLIDGIFKDAPTYTKRAGSLLLILGTGVFVYTMVNVPSLNFWGCLKAAYSVMGIANTIILFVFLFVSGVPIYITVLMSVMLGIPSVGILLLYYIYFMVEYFHRRKG